MAGLGGLFHRFGRCPNQDDFLEEFVFQSAPKLVLVTLASFGHCTNMSSFPAANTDSLDVQLWLHARFVQEGWRERHVAPQEAPDQVAKL